MSLRSCLVPSKCIVTHFLHDTKTECHTFEPYKEMKTVSNFTYLWILSAIERVSRILLFANFLDLHTGFQRLFRKNSRRIWSESKVGAPVEESGERHQSGTTPFNDHIMVSEHNRDEQGLYHSDARPVSHVQQPTTHFCLLAHDTQVHHRRHIAFFRCIA